MSDIVRTSISSTLVGLLLAASVGAHAQTQTDVRPQSEVSDASCTSMEVARDDMEQKQAWTDVVKSVDSYAVNCSTLRSHGEMAVALSDKADALLRLNRPTEALGVAHQCLAEHYDLVLCHARKAQSLRQLRLKNEAVETVRTGWCVAQKARRSLARQVEEANKVAVRAGQAWLDKRTRELSVLASFDSYGEAVLVDVGATLGIALQALK